MAVAASGIGLTVALAVPADRVDRGLGEQILQRIQTRVVDEYYDPSFGGFDFNGRCEQARERLARANSNSEMFRIIGQVFLDLDDSHTRFLPPRRAAKIEQGWAQMVVGDACFVRSVQEKSDAHAKGLRPGDRIESIDGLPANRATLWKIHYLLYGLDPQGGLRVVAISPGGETRTLELMAKVTPRSRVLDLRSAQDLSRVLLEQEERQENRASAFAEVGDTLIWRLPSFDRPPSDLDDGLRRLPRAKALILDLRGNSGGRVDTLFELLGRMFDHDVILGERRERHKTVALKARSGGATFKGLVIVLVDAQSASASELFARAMQLEDRGIVIGDRTTGATQVSSFFPEAIGVAPVVMVGVSVTHSAVVMRDGKPLEKVGVRPDLPVLPTGADLAAGSDPALAKALMQVGQRLTPEEAGRLLPRSKVDDS